MHFAVQQVQQNRNHNRPVFIVQRRTLFANGEMQKFGAERFLISQIVKMLSIRQQRFVLEVENARKSSLLQLNIVSAEQLNT
jgi:hypothetical protein